jgi:hypothetical protein
MVASGTFTSQTSIDRGASDETRDLGMTAPQSRAALATSSPNVDDNVA